MGYTVMRPEDQSFAPPSWRPEEPVRRIFEIPLHATMQHSRAHIWRYPAGAKGRRHKQLVQEEVFVVLEGTPSMLLGEPPERVQLSPRTVVVVEPETPLVVMNEADDDALLFIYGAPADGAAEILE